MLCRHYETGYVLDLVGLAPRRIRRPSCFCPPLGFRLSHFESADYKKSELAYNQAVAQYRSEQMNDEYKVPGICWEAWRVEPHRVEGGWLGGDADG